MKAFLDHKLLVLSWSRMKLLQLDELWLIQQQMHAELLAEDLSLVMDLFRINRCIAHRPIYWTRRVIGARALAQGFIFVHHTLCGPYLDLNVVSAINVS